MNEHVRYRWKVCARCVTFNQAPFIEEALNGFCMQETNFPFVCVILDDASTDGEPDIIRHYVEKHFDLEDTDTVRNEETDDYLLTFARHNNNRNCYFAVLLLKYNHYRIKKNKVPYISAWLDDSEYRAICEGDDYWIDPLKLQKQVDFMDSHPECTMTCNRTKLYSERQHKFIGERYCQNHSQFLNAKEIIERGGLYISTCSMLYNEKFVMENYPDYCKKCAVGDYPLQIMCAMKGRVYYFDELMSVYRIDISSSWMGQQSEIKTTDKKLASIKSEVNMLDGFAKDYPKYSEVFLQRANYYICYNYPNKATDKAIKSEYRRYFKDKISKMGLIWKLFIILRHFGKYQNMYRLSAVNKYRSMTAYYS